jgi:hypothetical protein
MPSGKSQSESVRAAGVTTGVIAAIIAAITGLTIARITRLIIAATREATVGVITRHTAAAIRELIAAFIIRVTTTVITEAIIAVTTPIIAAITRPSGELTDAVLNAATPEATIAAIKDAIPSEDM